MNKPRLIHILTYFLKLGTMGFGGSIALANSMQRDLVEKKRWLSNDDFTQGMTLSQLAPGPLSAQLAIYCGYVSRGIIGATIAGIAFVLPSFVLVVGLSVLYLRLGNSSHIQSALYGVGAAVVGIIAASAISLTKRNLKPKRLLWIIFLVTFVLGAVYRQTNIMIFLLAGIAATVRYNPGVWKLAPRLFPIIIPHFVFGSSNRPQPFERLFAFFLQIGAMAFGGGLAIVPLLQSGVVDKYHWLTNTQFVDAIAVAMITPGPVVIAAAFIGYLVGGLTGALVATVAIFLPVYCVVILLTPFFVKWSHDPRIVSFIEGVIAAAMGTIAGSILLLGQKSITDPATIAIGLTSFLLVEFFDTPGIAIVTIAGLAGVLIYR